MDAAGRAGLVGRIRTGTWSQDGPGGETGWGLAGFAYGEGGETVETARRGGQVLFAGMKIGIHRFLKNIVKKPNLIG